MSWEGYKPSMLIGMDAFPTRCFFDTCHYGRVILRQDPHVFVMTMVRFFLGEARSVVQPMLSLSGSYVVRSVNPTSTSMLAEEG